MIPQNIQGYLEKHQVSIVSVTNQFDLDERNSESCRQHSHEGAFSVSTLGYRELSTPKLSQVLPDVRKDDGTKNFHRR